MNLVRGLGVYGARNGIHALTALADRDIDRADVEQTLAAPAVAGIDPPQRVVLMRRYFDVQSGL
jgi:hypothetical protein